MPSPANMKATRNGRVFLFEWSDYGIHIRVSRIREQHNGDWRGMVDISNGDVAIHKSMVNLSIDSSRGTLIKSLPVPKKFTWSSVIADMTGYVLEALAKGDPLEEVWSSGEVEPVRYLLSPLLPENQPTILFGKGGSFKSYLADLIAVIVQLPWPDNPLGWATQRESANVIYLDWETDRGTFQHRLKKITRGMGLPDLGINYRRCTQSLVSDLEAIHGYIMDTKAKFVVIDSAGRACGGDLKDAAVVNDFFAAVREIGVTTLIIHHTAKDDLLKTKTPFGSVYFENNARSVWEVQKEQQAGDTEMIVSLTNTKVNEGVKQRPIGLQIQFDDVYLKTRFLPFNLKESGLASTLPVWERARDLLLTSAPLSVQGISQSLGESQETIRRTLNRYKTLFLKVGKDQWGVLTND